MGRELVGLTKGDSPERGWHKIGEEIFLRGLTGGGGDRNTVDQKEVFVVDFAHSTFSAAGRPGDRRLLRDGGIIERFELELVGRSLEEGDLGLL